MNTAAPANLALLQMRRRNFIGNTDKYLPIRSSPADAAVAVRDELAFLNVIGDAGIYNELYRETALQRITRYKRFARMYEGRHYENEWEDGERKPVFNFCQAISDKSVDFFAEKGFTVGSTAGNEDLASAVDYVWQINEKQHLLRKMGLAASVMGDAFLYVTLDPRDYGSNDPEAKLPSNQWKIKLYPIDPFFCFPVFDDIAHHEMKACMFQIPIGKDGKGTVTFKTLYITPDNFQEVSADGVIGQSQPNPFGMVNVIHFPNYDDPLKVWGQSDLESVCSLNEEYNIVANSVRKIIKYHAEPTTIIFGARASRLEKGAKKVWSGLPENAKVENLEFKSDLMSTYKYMELLEDNIHKFASIPSVLFQTDRAVSHTSAIAMKMLYQPILEKTERKQQAFMSAFRRVNKVMFKAFDIIKFDYQGLSTTGSDVTINDLYPDFPDPLPYDENGQVDVDTKKLAMGVTSRAALARKYNPSADLAKITAEILADQMADLMLGREKAIALQGGIPNPTVLTTSSLGFDESIVALAKKLSAIVPENPPPADPANPNPPKPGHELGDEPVKLAKPEDNTVDAAVG